jgi:uncharacterized protein (TIGR03083 family)
VSDLSGVYETARRDVSELLNGLSSEELHNEVPATGGWTIRDIAAHLTGDAACLLKGDFPKEFFEAFGDEAAVVKLNEWTAGMVKDRADMAIPQLMEEWDRSAESIVKMMRGDEPWPEELPWFADRVLVTDLAVHQQDINGALGIEKDRDAPQVKIGLTGYIATMDFRLQSAGKPAVRLTSGDKEWTAGGDDPVATVSASRFELFRAMSGRRNPDQIRAYDWEGDAEPFIPYFYPYGVRAEPLVE